MQRLSLSLAFSVLSFFLPLSLVAGVPEGNFVNLSMNNVQGNDDEISVELFNVFGQRVEVLFKGQVSEANTTLRLELPKLASGVYMVNVYMEGQVLHQQQLSIVQ